MSRPPFLPCDLIASVASPSPPSLLSSGVLCYDLRSRTWIFPIGSTSGLILLPRFRAGYTPFFSPVPPFPRVLHSSAPTIPPTLAKMHQWRTPTLVAFSPSHSSPERSGINCLPQGRTLSPPPVRLQIIAQKSLHSPRVFGTAPASYSQGHLPLSLSSSPLSCPRQNIP